jgi:pyrroline-5-carboxylate reductase
MEEARGSHIVIIAVKPQVLPSIWDKLAALKPDFFISIAAGVTVEKLVRNLGTDKVARFMPNIAAKIGYAVTAVTYSKALDEAFRKDAMDVATSVGSAFELEENLFSAFIGISGSGIAYMFEFMHQMAMGGVREGIAYPKALSIVADTMLSAANLQKQTGRNAVELETMVCSAKGTTIEGIAALSDGNFSSAVINAVSAAARKSEELEKKA